MRIFLTGVGCVGKSATGRKLAELLGVPFFDLDEEIEAFFGESIERLQSRFLTIHGYREKTVKALIHLLNRSKNVSCVIALPPSGLMGAYLRVIKKAAGIVIAIDDTPENILQRISFYDVNSKPVSKVLTPQEKRWYLKDIRKDLTYFGKTYRRANLRVNIEDLDVDGATRKLKKAVEAFLQQATV